MTTSTQALSETLATLVSGPDALRPASDSDIVAGKRPTWLVEPADEREVAAVLAFATREGLAVTPRGGGTQIEYGSPPTRSDIVLSMRRLNTIIEHAPHDQIVAVGAGISLNDLQAHLAETRQWLALDPPLAPEATIGGLVATNVSGARRLRYGGVRDQIIGVRVALADGTLASGGGKVVKNVAGYDLPKLFTGSLGTLGAIVAVTFRLYPIAAFTRTLIFSSQSVADLCDLVLRVNASTLVPSACDIFGVSDAANSPTLAIRFESGVESAITDQTQALLALAGSLGDTARDLSDENDQAFWRDADTRDREIAAETAPFLRLKVSLLPTEIPTWLEELRVLAINRTLDVRWRAHVAHGLLDVWLSGQEDTLVNALPILREAAIGARGSLVVTHYSPPLTGRVDVWGPSAALDVMRRLKASFDPTATLNPGRFIGGL